MRPPLPVTPIVQARDKEVEFPRLELGFPNGESPVVTGIHEGSSATKHYNGHY